MSKYLQKERRNEDRRGSGKARMHACEGGRTAVMTNVPQQHHLPLPSSSRKTQPSTTFVLQAPPSLDPTRCTFRHGERRTRYDKPLYDPINTILHIHGILHHSTTYWHYCAVAWYTVRAHCCSTPHCTTCCTLHRTGKRHSIGHDIP